MYVGIELVNEQMKEQDISCLPTLRVSDITAETPATKITTQLAGN